MKRVVMKHMEADVMHQMGGLVVEEVVEKCQMVMVNAEVADIVMSTLVYDVAKLQQKKAWTID